MEGNWKPLIYKGIDLTDRFLVSDRGEIFSLKSNKILKQVLNKSSSYYCICVSLGSRKEKKAIKPHIAVACMFVPGEAPELVVNHKDGNKTNNYFENLEWVTLRENSIHAAKNGLFFNCKKVKCLNNGMTFLSLSEACRWCGVDEGAQSLREYFSNPNRKTAGKDPITGERLRWELVC